ncbi:MAG: TonB C-terminal domain-containing protein [bacterium]
MRLEFYQACILSSLIHGILLFGFLPGQRAIIHVPLSVELIKIPSRIIKQPEETIQPAEKTPDIEKEKKEEKETQAKPVQETPASQPQATTQITLEAVRFPYMYYLNMIRKKVSMHWDWPAKQGTYKAVIYFKIMHSGEIVGIKLDTQSANQLFDDAALRAIKLSDPFSPLPGGFDEDFLGVYFEFNFRE